MHRGYKFRLRPDAEQEDLLRRAAGCCRYVWNWFLSERNNTYFASEGRLQSNNALQDAQLKHLKKHLPWLLKDSLSQALQQTLADLDKAFERYFTKKAGRPNRKRREDGDRFRVPQGFDRNGQAVFLPKIGWIRCRFTRPIPGKVCYVTVSREGDQWYASFCTDLSSPADTRRERRIQSHASEAEALRREAQAGGVIGIDWGIEQPLTLSTGEVIDLPRVTEREQLRLALLHRSVSVKTRGSKNRVKAVLRLGDFRRKLRNRLRDRLHKVTTDLAKNHRLIAIEDLQVKNMTASARGTVESPGTNVAQKAGLNRAILALAPGMFRELLSQKCEVYGTQLVAVAPHHTSQRCSCCGTVSPLNRPSRDRFKCVSCAHEANADVNAATNVLERAISLIAPEAGHVSVICTASGHGSGSATDTTLLAA